MDVVARGIARRPAFPSTASPARRARPVGLGRAPRRRNAYRVPLTAARPTRAVRREAAELIVRWLIGVESVGGANSDSRISSPSRDRTEAPDGALRTYGA